MNKKTVITGLVLITIAIILGAFGAHGLKKIISPEKISSFEVGVRYQIYVGFLLLIIGLNKSKLPASSIFTNKLLLYGTTLFSGSIYLLSLEELTTFPLRKLGIITPIGGSLIILGLIYLIRAVIKQNPSEK